MNDSVLAAGLAAGGHSGAGGAVMFAVLGLVALAGYGVYRWRQRH
jgi:MYXO-CTERM domain-containing protein